MQEAPDGQSSHLHVSVEQSQQQQQQQQQKLEKLYFIRYIDL